MKKTFLTLMGLITLITLFTFSSCKKDRTAPEYQTFELVYATTNYILGTSSEMSYGRVTIWDDNEFFYVLFEIYESLVDEGWGFNTTYIYLGDYEDLVMVNGYRNTRNQSK